MAEKIKKEIGADDWPVSEATEAIGELYLRSRGGSSEKR